LKLTAETDLINHRESETLKLVTIGRKTRLPHVVILRYVFRNRDFFVVAGKERSDWAVNAVASREAIVRLGNYSLSVNCEKYGDRNEILGLFTKKYGKRVVASWYPDSGVCLRLASAGQLSMRGSVNGENDTTLDFKAWRETGRDYYSAIAEAFDSASDEYDFTINQNFINVWIRKKSIRELLSIVKPEDVLLEIGSGTGAEALELSKSVRGIVATDISSKMVSLLRRKIQARGLEEKIKPIRLGAFEIEKARDYLPNGKTRVAYSFNGALNCELRIREFPSSLWKVLEPGGLFVCSVRNTLCLSEALSHASVFQLNRMAPRKKQPVMVSVGGMDIPSYYYPPGKFVEFFRSYFKLKKMIGLPALMPPAYLSNVYVKVRKVLFFLENAENALAGLYPVNRFGDQTLLVFERRDRAV